MQNLKIEILNIEMSEEETLEIDFNSPILEIRKSLIKYLRRNSVFKIDSLVNIGIFLGEQKGGVGFVVCV